MKYCDFNGCRNKIKRGFYCDEHKRSRQSIKKKQSKKSIYHNKNKPFYNSKPWRFIRTEIYQREKGCCQKCGRFVFGKDAHVHHIIPINDDPTLKLEENNLKLLCPKCHTIEENEEKKEKVFPSYFKK
ncbi:HNH endonuclease [Neobacillus sp. WH10]|uniref:HNH endonuclease n=1 Tax=Neobacillus sp. WH10 TaxID=3047873 RepID=UPI0024C15145|nr:HNH endonuclease [Neobacillus sp. WH10]WHY75716.1 HNH endonuclease [Neobacillus sp. WH10]